MSKWEERDLQHIFFSTEKAIGSKPSLIHDKEPFAGGRVCKKLVEVIEGRVKSAIEESWRKPEK